MFKNSKKQGDAGLGQAIAYFTMKGYDVALPLTDSADWDMIVEIDGTLNRVQVKTSSQVRSNVMIFNVDVKGGNKTNTSAKTLDMQHWDLLFLYHLTTKQKALIPKLELSMKCQLNLGEKYKEFLIE